MSDNMMAQPALEVDENLESGDDSTYDESIVSGGYLTSLVSSIKDYQYENGRRYHAYHEGAYLLPNDEEEQDRMDFLHHIYRLMLSGSLQLAPIGSNPQWVLDLGTGTGIWAVQFADEFPSAQVIGTDLSPIQPSWAPNCRFEIDDYESNWLFQMSFDFIHARELEGCVADEDKLFRQVFQNLKPGGYFEIDGAFAVALSDDDSHKNAETTLLWFERGRDIARRFGKPVDQAPHWKEKLEKAGFVDVREHVLKLPFGPWPKDPKLKEIGKYSQVQQLQAYESYTPGFLNRIGGWSKEETTLLLANLRNEIMDKSLHIYIPLYFVYGRKPL